MRGNYGGDKAELLLNDALFLLLSNKQFVVLCLFEAEGFSPANFMPVKLTFCFMSTHSIMTELLQLIADWLTVPVIKVVTTNEATEIG